MMGPGLDCFIERPMERGDLLVVRHFSQYLHRLLDMQKVRPLPSGWPVFHTYKIVLAKQADESAPCRILYQARRELVARIESDPVRPVAAHTLQQFPQRVVSRWGRAMAGAHGGCRFIHPFRNPCPDLIRFENGPPNSASFVADLIRNGKIATQTRGIIGNERHDYAVEEGQGAYVGASQVELAHDDSIQ